MTDWLLKPQLRSESRDRRFRFIGHQRRAAAPLKPREGFPFGASQFTANAAVSSATTRIVPHITVPPKATSGGVKFLFPTSVSTAGTAKGKRRCSLQCPTTSIDETTTVGRAHHGVRVPPLPSWHEGSCCECRPAPTAAVPGCAVPPTRLTPASRCDAAWTTPRMPHGGAAVGAVRKRSALPRDSTSAMATTQGVDF